MKKKVIYAAVFVGLFLFGMLLAWFFFHDRTQVPETKKENLVQELQQPFSATATIKLNQITATADLNRTAQNTFTLHLTEPAALKDLSFQYNGEDITASYHGMSVSISDDSLVAKTLAGVLFRSLSSATEGTGVDISSKDGILLVKGENEDGRFSMQIDPKHSSILNLEVPSLDLSCEFSDFLFQKNTESE